MVAKAKAITQGIPRIVVTKLLLDIYIKGCMLRSLNLANCINVIVFILHQLFYVSCAH